MLKSYKDLKVWQNSYGLCLDIYRITRKFPKEERYALTSQTRRSAVSVLSNIAESQGGTISIESIVNRGTKTKINLPKATRKQNLVLHIKK